MTMKSFFTLTSFSIVALSCAAEEKEQPTEYCDQELPAQDTSSPSNNSDASGTEDSNDTTSPEDTGEANTDSGDSELAVYCEGNDPELANCDPERSYDPWTAHGGEVHYWIRDAKTEVYPFTVIYEPAIWYGYLHLTTGERVRDKYTEDIFSCLVF